MALLRDPERRREFEAILDAIDEAIMTVDRDFCVVGYNQAAERLTGYDRREAVGGRCFDVCAGRFCQHSCDIEMMFATGAPPGDFDTVVQGKDGRVRVVRVRTIPFRDRRGRILAAIRILKDVTGTVPMVQAEGAVDETLIGEGPAMQRVYRVIERLRDSEAPLMVWGPAGTEKESLARTVHARSLRAGGPFVTVHTGGLGSQAAEREVERALLLGRAGTLYVHDFSHLPDAVRARWFQSLSEAACPGTSGEPARSGRAQETRGRGSGGDGQEPHHPVAPRLIAAVDVEPSRSNPTGGPEPGLVLPVGWHAVSLPPLAQRREDIPLLVDHFLQRLRADAGANVSGLTARALRALMSYGFPENVEELERILRFALAFRRATWAERVSGAPGQAAGQGDAIDLEDLPPEVRGALPAADVESLQGSRPAETLTRAARSSAREPAREQLLETLEATGWHLGRTASRLGINRTTLWRRMKRLGIHRP